MKSILSSFKVNWRTSKFGTEGRSANSVITVTKGAKLAIIVHLYYTDLWPSISSQLRKINVPFDLYLSVQEKDKNFPIERINDYQGATNILAFPNKGRDVLPFLQIANILEKKRRYQYILKLHTKKSLHRIDGNDWLDSLLKELIPDDVTPIIKTLEKKDTGSIGPESHVVSLSRYLGDNRSNIEKILHRITSRERTVEIIDKASLYPFFGGTMFWARLDLFDSILSTSLGSDSYEDEGGQVDGTTAHALERVFGGLLHAIQNRKMYTVGESGVKILEEKLYEDEYRYVG